MVNGAGSAGIACTKLFMAMGLKHVILCDRDGAIYEGKEGLNEGQRKWLQLKIVSIKGFFG